jgi:ParB-like chromosome segregation protein Spo0J
MKAKTTEPHSNDDPVLLDVNDIKAHPKNPRLSLRGDVIEAIAASLRQAKEYPKHHAITVRRSPNGTYEIILGHHRVKACLKAMVLKIWAFVVEADDEEAYRMLAFGNAQGELGSLEIGLHALDAVKKAPGQAGMGIRAYAAAMGLKEQNLGRYIVGARVFRAVEASLRAANIDIGGCREKADHFHAIGTAPRGQWDDIAVQCVRERWSVTKTRARVSPRPAHPERQDSPTVDGVVAELAQADSSFASFLSDLLDPTEVLGNVAGNNTIAAALIAKWPVLASFADYAELRQEARLVVGSRRDRPTSHADRREPESHDDASTGLGEPASTATVVSLEATPLPELLTNYWLCQAELHRRLIRLRDADLSAQILFPDNGGSDAGNLTDAAKITAGLVEAALRDGSPNLVATIESVKARYSRTDGDNASPAGDDEGKASGSATAA